MTENLPMAINWNDKSTIATLKATVAQGATNEEFAMFAEFCRSTKLNPFKKEIWFIKAGGRVQLMTGINGYWSIANSHPQFDGAETGMIAASGEWVKSVPGNDFIGAWCRVYRKDRRIPMEGEALLSDYRKQSPLWNNSPRIMIKKVAQSIALRQAFSSELSGLYTAEEMPPEYAAPRVEAAAAVEPEPQIEETPKPKAEKKAPKKLYFYDFSKIELVAGQLDFLESVKCEYDKATGIWACPVDLGKKLSQFRCDPAKKAAEDDDIPASWTKAADAAAEQVALK